MPDTSIVPVEGRTTWAPGIREGIPLRPLIHAVIHSEGYGHGTIEASGAIQTAIYTCPLGQTVMLSAGTFLCNNHVLLNKGVTLMGAGSGGTILQKTNGATAGSYQPQEAEPIIIVGPNRWPKWDGNTSVNLSADAVQGASTVAVANPAGFSAGQFVLLDEDDYNAAAWVPVPDRGGQPSGVRIWASDRVVFQKHDPPEAGDDGFPESLSWFSRPGRPLCEIKEILSVTGNVLTFTTPIHLTYRQAQAAQLTRYVDPHVIGAGVEDLTLTGGSDGNIRFEVAAHCWMRNVESTLWLGEAVSMWNSFRLEVRDSFIHDGAWPYPGGGGYGLGLSAGTSEVLIENNAVVGANHGVSGTGINKVMAVKSAGAGCVVGYNYLDNGSIANYPAWVEVGINGSHMVGSHHILFEGNQSNNYDSDNTHGNAIAMTVFRNHLIGRRRDFPEQSNARCAGLMFGSWWHSFIGNVLGEPDGMGAWVYESSYPWPDFAVWKLGYDPNHWDSAPDPKVLSTVLRDGNFDYVTGAVNWDRPKYLLPPSLYLESKPEFFGSLAWPWVTPGVITQPLGILPARVRYEAWANGLEEPPPPPELFCTDGPTRYVEGEELSIETKQRDRAKLVAQMTPQGWTLLETEKHKGGALWCRFKCVGKPQP